MLDVVFVGDRQLQNRRTGLWETIEFSVLNQTGMPMLRAFVRPDGTSLNDLVGLSPADRDLLVAAPTASTFAPVLCDVLGGVGRIVGVDDVHLMLPEGIQRVIPCESLAIRMGLELGFDEDSAALPGYRALIAASKTLVGDIIERDAINWGAPDRALVAHAVCSHLDNRGVPRYVANSYKMVGQTVA